MGTSGTRLRVGLIGAGLVGQAAHAHFLWDDRERFDLVALADPSAAVRAAVGDRYGIAERHAVLDGLLGLGLDAIVVAVPDAFHADVACQGLEAGLHVLCEKPLALSLEECDRIAAARDASGRVLQVGTMKRYDPAYLRLLELLPERAADVRYLSIEVRDPDQRPVRRAPAHDGRLRSRARARPASCAARMAARDPRGRRRRPAAPAERARSRPTSRRSCTTSASCRACSSGSASPGASAPTTAPGGTTDAAVSLSAALPGGGRAHLVHHNLPGVNDYRERVTLHCSDRVLELTFPSPYLRHQPTRLVEHRSDGAIGLRSTLHHVSYEEAFRAGAARVRGRLRGPRGRS